MSIIFSMMIIMNSNNIHLVKYFTLIYLQIVSGYLFDRIKVSESLWSFDDTDNMLSLSLIKYENLINDREVEFGKITEYLKKFENFHFDENQTERIIESCSFEKLQKEEQENGFKEAAKQLDGVIKKFFFLGPKNKWENILKINIKEDLENNFKNEMKELGYL